MSTTLSDSRQAWLPAPVLPLTYFAGAHLALLMACGLLAVAPDVAGPFHYHPRMVAVTHMVTLGWITASILGALYIVAPLALGFPLRAGAGDGVTAAAFWGGTVGMVSGFWHGQYAVVGASALFVLFALGWVAARVALGLRTARVPAAVSAHLLLAFANVIGAGAFGVFIALDRASGWVNLSPMAVAASHAHVAIVGWAIMMIVGVAYRLVPMFLPAAMPAGRVLMWSAVFLEIGTLGMAWALATGGSVVVWASSITAGIVWFAVQVRRMLRTRRPRPAAMVGRDWATWQTHVALLYLPLSIGLGVWLSTSSPPSGLTWVYGVAAIVGFVSQMVVGIQGRLLPMHAWYVAMGQHGGTPPRRSVHDLYEARVARVIFLLWLAGVPLLAAGLSGQRHALIRAGASLLAASVVVQAGYGVRMVGRAVSAPVATS